MKYIYIRILPLITVLLLSGACNGPANDSSKTSSLQFVTIGTGGITGVYYPAGGAISKMVNAKRAEYGIRCTVEATGGSVFNVNAILNGDLEFGIVQSDRQYQAWNGLAEWADKGKQSTLRSVFSLHPESVTLVAEEDSGIKTFGDLKGKRVNIGNPGSGQRQNAIDALTIAGFNLDKDLDAENIKASEAAGLLQDGRIDAFFYTVGHPAGSIKEATAGHRKVLIVPIPFADKLVAKFPYYTESTIPIKFYPGAIQEGDVPTFGVKATVVTSETVSDDVVYAITREVFENLKTFKTLHPAFEFLTKESMLKGLTAPLHPGAIRYFKETGLM